MKILSKIADHFLRMFLGIAALLFVFVIMLFLYIFYRQFSEILNKDILIYLIMFFIISYITGSLLLKRLLNDENSK